MENQQANDTILASLMANLIPLDALPNTALRQLARHLRPQRYPAGRELSLSGIHKHLYLLQGQVTLLHEGKPIRIVRGGTPEARHALNRNPSTALSLKSETDCLFLFINLEQVRQLAEPEQTTSVSSPRSKALGWLQQLLEKPIFRRLPPENLRKVLNNVEPLHPDEGSYLLTQGQLDDHYYIIQQGQCSVMRSKDDTTRQIDSLGVGDTFGAITLLSEHPSFVSTIMDRPGQILRMDKNDFHDWVAKPLEKTLDYRRATQLAKKGAVWLDVRCAEEYSAGHLPNSIHIPLQHLNIPFSTLVKLIRGLDPSRPYLVYSNSEKRAGAASFRFMEQDLNTMILEGGVESLPQDNLTNISTAKLMRMEKEREVQRARMQAQRRQIAAQRKPKPLADEEPSSANADEMLQKAKIEIARLQEKRRLSSQAESSTSTDSASAKHSQAPNPTTIAPSDKVPESPEEAQEDDVQDERESLTGWNNKLWIVGIGLLLLLSAIGYVSVMLIRQSLWPTPSSSPPTMVVPVITETAQDATPILESEPALVEPPSTTEPAPTEVPAQALFSAVRSFRDKIGHDEYGPEMVELPGGTFLMGAGANHFNADELPQIAVDLNTFSISKYEITFEEYGQYTRDTGRIQPDDRGWGEGRQPVINITWREAKQYTQWLSEKTGHNYRLPSEREWEYAASAGNNTLYGWGNNMIPGRINCADCNTQWSTIRPAPVGSFEPNALGLHDMLGNVMEWTEVCQHLNYQDAPRAGNIWYGGICHRRMVRGGSYRRYTQDIRITKRTTYPPSARSDELGFRVVRLE